LGLGGKETSATKISFSFFAFLKSKERYFLACGEKTFGRNVDA
jgi:hypothetical protein